VNNGALMSLERRADAPAAPLPKQTAAQVLHLTSEWREGAAVIFDRQLENQLMLEVLDRTTRCVTPTTRGTWNSSGWQSLWKAA